MLSNRDLYKEIDDIEKLAVTVEDKTQKAMLKIGTLGLKLLHNIRTNQVEIMKKQGIELVPSNRERQNEESPTQERSY